MPRFTYFFLGFSSLVMGVEDEICMYKEFKARTAGGVFQLPAILHCQGWQSIPEVHYHAPVRSRQGELLNTPRPPGYNSLMNLWVPMRYVSTKENVALKVGVIIVMEFGDVICGFDMWY
jgi:hypothetical protein